MFAIHYPRRTLVWVFLLLLVLMAGLPKLALQSDFRLYFSSDNPQLMAFEQVEQAFNKQDTLSFVLSVNNGDLLSVAALTEIKKLTDAAWTLPYVRRVDSLTNYQQIRSDQDVIEVADFFTGTEAVWSATEALRSVRDDADLLNRYINADASLGLVVMSLDLPGDNPQATSELVGAARQLLHDADLQSVTVELFGSAVINLALQEAVERDMAALIPGSYLLIFAGLFLLTRSLAGSMLALGITLLTIMATFGAYGWVFAGSNGIAVLTPVVGVVPSMIMIVVIADCLHLLSSYQHYLREGLQQSAALEQTLRINSRPVWITSITTAVGLLCLNFSESPPYRDLGNLVAFAAMLAALLSVTAFIAVLAILRPPAHRQLPGRVISAALADFSQRVLLAHPLRSLLLLLLLATTAAAGMSRLEFNEQWHRYYDETFAVRQVLDKQDEQLHGVNFIQYRIEAADGGTLYRTEVMHQLQQFADYLDHQPQTGFTDSVHRPLLTLNKALHAGDEAFYRIPANDDAVAQTMLLYEMSLPAGMGLNERITLDQSATRLTVNLHKQSSGQLIQFDEQARLWAAANTPALRIQPGTGLDMVFAWISDRNSISLFKGTLLALVLISALMLFVLRSWRLALISLIPNILPALMAYGLWGYWVGQVDLGLSIVACMSLGLVVDDTVHFLSKYQLARRQGESAEGAVRYAFATVGTAMLVTSVILAAGFALLLLSPFSPTWGMGGLMALTVVLALAADLLLLPLLLVLFDRQPLSISKD